MPSTAERLVIVTGASSGIGLALVRRLRKAGLAVVSIDRDGPPTDVDVAAHHRCDLADPAAVTDLVEQLDTTLDLGSVAAVANVAGVPGTLPANVVLEVNLLAVRALCRGLARRLSSGAAFVNVASISGNGWCGQSQVVLGKTFGVKHFQ